MIAGLGEAAKLVFKNVAQYSDHMEKIRDYLEKKLKVQNQIIIKFKNKLLNWIVYYKNDSSI